MKSVLILSPGGWSQSILSSFLVSALKTKFPRARFTLVIDHAFADWAPCLHFDHVIFEKTCRLRQEVTNGQKGRRWLFALKLRRHKYDLAINLDRFQSHAAILKAGGVKRVIEENQGPVSLGEIDRFLRILAQLEVTPSSLNFKLKVRQHVHDDVITRLGRLGLQPKSFLAVAPGGGMIRGPGGRLFQNKRWPFFSEFIRLASQRSPWPVLLLGGQEEREMSLSLIPPGAHRLFSWIGETTREEALAVTGEARAFVGIDSGLSQLAGSVGVPTVILYGPTSPHTRYPPDPNGRVIRLQGAVPCAPCQKPGGDFDWECADPVCMKSLSPEMVWRALDHLVSPRDVAEVSSTRR